MYPLWNTKIPFPAVSEMPRLRGVRYVIVHEATEDTCHFLLGAAIIKHNDVLYTSFANSRIEENDESTVYAQKRSVDGAQSWGTYETIAKVESGFGRSHGVYHKQNGTLYAFCPRARFRDLEAYPELLCEGYRRESDGSWTSMGIVLPHAFWPMCQPIALRDGGLLMAGLETEGAQAAIALCDGKDLCRWEMRVLPNPNGFSYWGETTVLRMDDRLLAIVRGGRGISCALVSESTDEGRTWSGLQESNLPICLSKMYALTLSDGRKCLFFNARGERNRDTLCVAIGEDCFSQVYVLRHGFDAPPKFRKDNQWCYPYAYEDRKAGVLYVVYAKNKEDCELAILPLGKDGCL